MVDGPPVAVWCITHDITPHVVGERRLAMLRELADCSKWLVFHVAHAFASVTYVRACASAHAIV